MFLVAGVGVYLLPLPLPVIDPVEDRQLTEHITEIGVIIALMGAGLALNRPVGRRRASSSDAHRPLLTHPLIPAVTHRYQPSRGEPVVAQRPPMPPLLTVHGFSWFCRSQYSRSRGPCNRALTGRAASHPAMGDRPPRCPARHRPGTPGLGDRLARLCRGSWSFPVRRLDQRACPRLFRRPMQLSRCPLCRSRAGPGAGGAARQRWGRPAAPDVRSPCRSRRCPSGVGPSVCERRTENSLLRPGGMNRAARASPAPLSSVVGPATTPTPGIRPRRAPARGLAS